MVDPREGAPERARRLLAHLREHEAERPRTQWRLPSRFRPIRELGRGGMGSVVLAHDTKLQRSVAVKSLLAGEHAGLKARQRFEAEAKALGSIRHPHVVRVHELIREEGALFIVMDCVEGQTLDKKIEDGPLEPREAARIALALAEGLACAHEQGVLHRDVKPGNVVLTSDGGVVLVDFGIAKRMESSFALTATGQLLGTPEYLSPEQICDAKGVDARTDVYAVGGCLHRALTAKSLFAGCGLQDLLVQILGESAPDPREVTPTVPTALAKICLRCLQKDPRDRYPTATSLAEDLRAFLDGRPLAGTGWTPSERAASLLVAFLALCVLGLAGYAALLTPDTPPEPDRLAHPRGSQGEVVDPTVPPVSTPTQRPEEQLLPHPGAAHVAFLGASAQLVLSGGKSSVVLWQLGPAVTRVWAVDHHGADWLCVSADGNRIAFGAGPRVTVLDARGAVVRDQILGQQTLSGTWVADGSALYVGLFEPLGVCKLESPDWQPRYGVETEHPVYALALDADSGSLAWGTGSAGKSSNRRVIVSEGLPTVSNSLDSWELSGTPTVLRYERGLAVWVVGTASGTVHSIQVRPPAERHDPISPETLLEAPVESMLTRRRIADEQLLAVFRRSHRTSVNALAIVQGGLLVSGSGDVGTPGDIRVWDLQARTLLGTTRLSELGISSLSCSADGLWIAIGSPDQGALVVSTRALVAEAKARYSGR